ncbi:hypothetical protein VTN49DRAFT_1426 [Thermomyces lanuginosus]|uniref:uncharacterized protein n=1 Tax=Thermomyces lanuginosus TaxID=5541 RepID=UPI0037427FB7
MPRIPTKATGFAKPAPPRSTNDSNGPWTAGELRLRPKRNSPAVDAMPPTTHHGWKNGAGMRGAGPGPALS